MIYFKSNVTRFRGFQHESECKGHGFAVILSSAASSAFCLVPTACSSSCPLCGVLLLLQRLKLLVLLLLLLLRGMDCPGTSRRGIGRRGVRCQGLGYRGMSCLGMGRWDMGC